MDGGAIVRLPAGRAGPVEMPQVVEALVGAPPQHAAGVVKGGSPVHESVGPESAGRAVLEPRILPVGHDGDYAGGRSVPPGGLDGRRCGGPRSASRWSSTEHRDV